LFHPPPPGPSRHTPAPAGPGADLVVEDIDDTGLHGVRVVKPEQVRVREDPDFWGAGPDRELEEGRDGAEERLDPLPQCFGLEEEVEVRHAH
jgi:hypothetical protein